MFFVIISIIADVWLSLQIETNLLFILKHRLNIFYPQDSITTQYIYNEVEPVHSGLMHSPIGVETSHHSSSVTVSIFGALSEILSQTTESLSFLTSSTTDRAQSTSTEIPQTTTTTTTTTTSTTSAPPTTKFTSSTTEQVPERVFPEFLTVPNSIEVHVNNNQNYRTINHFDEITESENEIRTRSARLIESGTMFDPNIPTALPIPQVLKTKLTDTVDALKNNTKIAQLTIPITTVPNYILTNASPNLTSSMSPTDSSTSSTTSTIVLISNSDNLMTTKTFQSTEFAITKNSVPNNSNKDDSTKEIHTTIVTPLYTRQITLDEIINTNTTPNTNTLSTTTPKSDLHSVQIPIPTILTELSTIQDFSNLRSRLVTSLAETNQQRPIYIMPSSTTTESPSLQQLKTTLSIMSGLPLVETTTPVSRVQALSTNSTSNLLKTSSNTLMSTASTPIVTTAQLLTEAIPAISLSQSSSTTSRPSTLLSSSTEPRKTVSKSSVISSTLATGTQYNITMNSSLMEIPNLLSTSDSPIDYVPRFSKRIPILPVRPPKRDYVVYGILPNNTVVKKIIDENTTENPLIIYGIFQNNTVVRKYPNGTIVSADHNNNLEITDIDPKSLTDPDSDFYQHIHNEIVPNDTNTMPTEKEILITMAPSTYSTDRNLNATKIASTTITTIVNSTPEMVYKIFFVSKLNGWNFKLSLVV